ncbi:MAG: DUF1015 domain-containing protein [Bacteroidetes bacterium]|nr:DUF1015 domain-containing protein [Bacteroidota bacterium]
MVTIRPFRAFRPKPEYAAEVAARPYDVLSSEEAREEVKGHPFSFLHVGKPEVDLDPSIPLDDPRVYQKAKENLKELIDKKILLQDPEPYLYVYAQTMNGRTQYGLVGCASAEEYRRNIIKRHEFTRKDKEDDRCEHIRVTKSHSGPIFLTYRDVPEVNLLIASIVQQPPENDLIAPDGVRHQSWVISNPNTIKQIVELFRNKVPVLYIADGHHRSAAAVRVAAERAASNPKHTGDEEYNYFLAVYFPASQLKIMDYNRVVKDLNGLSKDEFLKRVQEFFTVHKSEVPVHPAKKGSIGMYLDGSWYQLDVSNSLPKSDDPIESLDVEILQRYVLDPILGIHDPRTDKRIDFVGGIRGLGELERRVNSGEMKVAFSMCPPSMDELMHIADEGKFMPPKSTWFEPKLRDGLFVHFFD